MIRYISNVLSGRFRHWNDANNPHVSVLFERAKALPSSLQPLFAGFTVASHCLVIELLGPSKGNKRIIKIDPKDVTSEQFRSLHHLNIWTFAGMFVQQNPGFLETILLACKDFIGVRDNENVLVQYIAKMEKFDLGKVSSALLKEIGEILHCDTVDPRAIYFLTVNISIIYEEVMERYQQELGLLSQ